MNTILILRDSPQAQSLEVERGVPIDRIVLEAVREAGTINGAADSLGVNRRTFWGWARKLGIKKVWRETNESQVEPVNGEPRGY